MPMQIYYLLNKADDGYQVLSPENKTLSKCMASFHWQMQGSFAPEDFRIGVPSNVKGEMQVTVDTASMNLENETVKVVKGAYTQEAYEELLDDIWPDKEKLDDPLPEP